MLQCCVCLTSVTLCIVAKRCVLEQTLLQMGGTENAGLENAGTSFVWVARHNIITVLRSCVRVLWKRVVN